MGALGPAMPPVKANDVVSLINLTKGGVRRLGEAAQNGLRPSAEVVPQDVEAPRVGAVDPAGHGPLPVERAQQADNGLGWGIADEASLPDIPQVLIRGDTGLAKPEDILNAIRELGYREDKIVLRVI